MTKKNGYLTVVLLGAVMVLGSFVVSHRAILAQGGVSVPEVYGSANGSGFHSLLVFSQPTRGETLLTAAINSNGTVAKCFGCDTGNTSSVGTGEYQIAFNQTVTANTGWSRWVQVDTLSTGAITNTHCSTADRNATPTAVWVNCYDGSGTAVDSSFFLFVAR